MTQRSLQLPSLEISMQMDPCGPSAIITAEASLDDLDASLPDQGQCAQGADGGTNMSEMGESYDPGPWKGFNFKSARATYDGTAGRGYGTPSTPKSTPAPSSGYSKSGYTSKKKTLENLVPDRVSTEARSPLVIVVDGTGSMGEFPEVIFKKLPLLDLGIEDYLEDCEISFAMIGDAAGDKYALQVQNFTKGKGLVDNLNKLVIEKGGGGNECESYDLAAAYYARNCDMPKATKPVLIYVSDEGIYSTLNKDWAKDHAKVDIEKAIKTKELFDELKSKFSVYCIRKHYGGGVDGEQMTGSNLAIHKQWQEYVGADRIAILNDPNRIVDVIFGLVAHETGKKEFFEEEINFRQTPEQVAEVMKSMLTVGREDYKSKANRTGKSVLLLPKSATGVRR